MSETSVRVEYVRALGDEGWVREGMADLLRSLCCIPMMSI